MKRFTILESNIKIKGGYTFKEPLHTCGGEHRTDLHHLAVPLSHIQRVQGLGPGT